MAENLPVALAFENYDLQPESVCSYSSPDWVVEAQEVSPLKPNDCGCKEKEGSGVEKTQKCVYPRWGSQGNMVQHEELRTV